MKKHEESLHVAVCNYLRLQHPGLIFSSEASGIRLTIGQAKKAKSLRSSAALPDLWIMEARGGYHGMLIELKKEGTRIKLKDGSMTTDAHIRAQAAVIYELQSKGYNALFCVGFDEAKKAIDKYMKSAQTMLSYF